jgi:peroxiredoxin
MTLLETPKAEQGSPIPNFDLPGTDGKNYSPANLQGAPAMVVVFTCNHCPYAQGVKPQLHELYEAFKEKQVQFVAINSNDAENYPEDSFEKMIEEKYDYPFPYLRDESQDVARNFGAVCTPDIFVYDSEQKLAYRGRINDNWQKPDEVTSHDLQDAITALLNGTKPSAEQFPYMGCSIKWK